MPSNPDGRRIIGETLRVLRLDMDSRVLPNLTDPDAQLAARMIADLLAVLTTWHLDLPDGVPDHVAAREALAGASAGDEDAFLTGDLPVETEAYGRATSRLQDKIEASAEFAREVSAAAVADERALLAEEAAKVADGLVLARERLAKVEVEATPERALRLADTLLGPGHTLVSLSRVPGGMSKESLFLEVRDASGAPRRLVIRRDLPWGPAQTTVRDEYALLTKLFERGLPIAEPLGCDFSGEILGQPAMLSARIPGGSGAEAWQDDAEARRAVCLELASVLARLHAIQPASVGMAPVSDDPREQLRAYVIEWRDRWRANRVHPSLTLAAAFAWLLDHIPSHVDRLCVVHGDVGFHNAIIHEGRLSAILDWEFFHVGDPTEDLSYCRQFVEPLIPWDDFLGVYYSNGGTEYREENAQFFELWRSVRNSVTCSIAWRGFLDGSYPALKMALQGISVYRYFVRNTAKALEERLK